MWKEKSDDLGEKQWRSHQILKENERKLKGNTVEWGHVMPLTSILKFYCQTQSCFKSCFKETVED